MSHVLSLCFAGPLAEMGKFRIKYFRIDIRNTRCTKLLLVGEPNEAVKITREINLQVLIVTHKVE